MNRQQRRHRGKPQAMAAAICDIADCQKCPGRDLCNHKEGKGNGLAKWLQATETK